MRRVLPIILLFVFATVCMSGCRDAETRRTLRRMMGSTVVLPENVICVQNGESFSLSDSVRHRPKLIIYIDSTECNTCRISHIWEYDELFRIAEENRLFDMVFLMYNTSFESIPLVRYVSDQNIIHPIYIDIENRFLTDNSIIPADSKYHSFLLTEKGKPIFIGDPTLSPQMFEAFIFELNDL